VNVIHRNATTVAAILYVAVILAFIVYTMPS
jgi:hypothetical protein